MITQQLAERISFLHRELASVATARKDISSGTTIEFNRNTYRGNPAYFHAVPSSIALTFLSTYHDYLWAELAAAQATAKEQLNDPIPKGF